VKREGIHNFIDELRRRKVYRAAAAYAIVGWVIIQVVATVFPILALPAWALRVVVVSVLAGFPMALAFAWAYELGPGGFHRTVDDSGDAARPRAFVRSRRNVIALVLVGASISIVCGYFLLARSAATPLDKSIAVLPFDNFSEEIGRASCRERV